MKRKLVALIVAIMMIGSCVGAFAIDGNGTYEQKDITAIENALATYYPAEQVIEGYTIKDGGLWMIVKLTTYSLRNSVAVGEPADADYVKYDNDRTEASMLAFLEKVVKEKTTTEAVAVGATEVIGNSIAELEAKYPGYTKVYDFKDKDGNVIAVLLSNGKDYVYGKLSASTVDQAPAGQPTTGPDAFDLDYLQYDDSVISAFAFKPEVFGNGITFSHKNAKSLFSMTVVYDSKVVIQLRDQEGRLYPVSGASYNAADNGYVTTMKAGESKTFGWYGTDGAGYHKAGTLAKPADIWLDLNVTVSTQAKDLAGVALMSGRADMRFDYKVSHGDNAHNGNYSGNSGSTSPKTGDARMAYLTLASLVVLAGVAVVITRKLRTNA